MVRGSHPQSIIYLEYRRLSLVPPVFIVPNVAREDWRAASRDAPPQIVVHLPSIPKNLAAAPLESWRELWEPEPPMKYIDSVWRLLRISLNLLDIVFNASSQEMGTNSPLPLLPVLLRGDLRRSGL